MGFNSTARVNDGEIKGRVPILRSNLNGYQTKPYRHPTSQQPDMPAGTTIIKRGKRGVPGLEGAQEDD